jgi:uncharacterized protein
MLSFDLRALESHAVRVDADLPADDPVWEDGDVRPVGAAHVTGRLSSAGAGKFYFSGQMTGTAAASCRRCLDDVQVPVDEALHLLLVEPGVDEAEEPDVYLIDARAHALDLRPALREEWLLAVNTFPLCRDDCRGLCPTCGANRNRTKCTCAPAADPRWNALTSPHDARR